MVFGLLFCKDAVLLDNNNLYVKPNPLLEDTSKIGAFKISPLLYKILPVKFVAECICKYEIPPLFCINPFKLVGAFTLNKSFDGVLYSKPLLLLINGLLYLLIYAEVFTK